MIKSLGTKVETLIMFSLKKIVENQQISKKKKKNPTRPIKSKDLVNFLFGYIFIIIEVHMKLQKTLTKKKKRKVKNLIEEKKMREFCSLVFEMGKF